MTSPSVQFVVAHYNEDLSWLEPVADLCLIYTKGNGKPTASPYVYVPLPNIGRESHTYLSHIVENYHSLPDVTLFLQGRIDDHVSSTLQQVTERARQTPPGVVTTFPFRELELFDHWQGIPWHEYPCWEKWSSMDYLPAPKSPGQCFKEFFGGEELPDSIGFHPGAIFAVHRDTIRSYPRSFYRRLLQEFFLGDMAHINPETGHYMERFWLAMWCPQEYICWDSARDTAQEKRNSGGQLARGRWHRTPRWVKTDPLTLHPNTRAVAVGGRRMNELPREELAVEVNA